MIQRSLACLAVLWFAVGCTETRQYNLRVKNGLNEPVTLVLTKTHGPAEDEWLSPEQLAGPPHPAYDDATPFQILDPGRTGTRTVTGKFDPELGRAVLRVYAGKPGLSRMNAMEPGTLNRIDVPLVTGLNDLYITYVGSTLQAVSPASTQPVTKPMMP